VFLQPAWKGHHESMVAGSSVKMPEKGQGNAYVNRADGYKHFARNLEAETFGAKMRK
jgi:hypothetical protein